MMNRKAFFDEVRSALFRGSLTPEQVAGMDAELDAFEKAGWPPATMRPLTPCSRLLNTAKVAGRPHDDFNVLNFAKQVDALSIGYAPPVL